MLLSGLLACQRIDPDEISQNTFQPVETHVELPPKRTEDTLQVTSTSTTPPSTPTAQPTAPAVLERCPSNSGKVVFVADIAEPGSGHNYELFNMEPDGSEMIQLTNLGGINNYPSWSPERCRVAFTSNAEDHVNAVYILNLADSSLFRLTNDAYSNKMPNWSPDGTRIAYVSVRDGLSDIFISLVDGSALSQLTDHPAEDIWLEWSPVDDRIAFSSGRDGNWEIYTINADGSELSNLSNHAMQDMHPTWSPDGNQLAFFSDRSGNIEIFIINADGSDLIQVSAFNGEPPRISDTDKLAWSPDGSSLAFIGNVPDPSWPLGIEDIFVLDIKGSGLTNLTNNSIYESNPDW